MSVLIKPLGLTDAAIIATDQTNFPNGTGSFAPFLTNSGQVQIDDEVISYVKHFMGRFTTLTRGANSTTVAVHDVGATVTPLAVTE